MQHWKEGLVAAAVVGLCLYGVVAQFAGDAPPEPQVLDIQPAQVGEVLALDVTLPDLEDPPRPRNVLGSYGRRATVLYTWSAACPCILDVEPRLKALAGRFGRPQGVAWLAVAGEPEEGLAELRAKRDRLQPFYPVLRDPEQRVCRRLGLRHAGQVAVLDGDGRLVFRGALDDDWEHGHAEFLGAALDAVLAGRRPEPAEQRHRYGCRFAVPASCREATPEGP